MSVKRKPKRSRLFKTRKVITKVISCMLRQLAYCDCFFFFYRRISLVYLSRYRNIEMERNGLSHH